MKREKRIPFDIISINGNIIYTTNDVWAYYYLPDQQYDFAEDSDKAQMVKYFNNAMTSLTTGTTAREFHLISTTRPMDTEEWANDLLARGERNDAKYELDDYIQKSRGVIDARDLRNKYVFLGVKLGTREMGSSGTFKDSLQSIVKMFDNVLDTSPKDVTDSELEKWETAENSVRNTMRQNLRADRIDSDDMAYLIKKQFFPAMPVTKISIDDREPWGKGDMTALTTSYIEHKRNHLRMIQSDRFGDDVEGYRATLSISRFPDTIDTPWIYFLSQLYDDTEVLDSPAGGYSFSARFKVLPPNMVKKDMKKKLRRALDEANNAFDAGVDVPDHLQEQYAAAKELQRTMERNPEHFIYGNYKIIVEAKTETDLKYRANSAIEHYSLRDIRLTWTTGDQLTSLIECSPGGKIFSRSFEQIQNINGVGGGMPTANNAVGDRLAGGDSFVGPYIGRTLNGISQPVFFSPHAAMARDKPGGVIIVGQPGGGKTYCALTITTQLAYQGVEVIYIDPKRDAESIVNLPALKNSQIINLMTGANGLLDPFRMSSDVQEMRLYVRETINFLVGQVKINSVPTGEIMVAINETIKSKHPTLTEVASRLRNSDDVAISNIGAELQEFAGMKFGHLLFGEANKENKGIDASTKLTIISMLGLELPDPTKNPDNYGLPERLSSMLMFFLGIYSSNLMISKDRKKPKALIIDEAWAMIKSEQGSRLISIFSRMGRSHNTAVILISQNAGEFLSTGDDGIGNMASTVFTFASQKKNEVLDTLKLLDLPDTDDNVSMIKSLGRGQCIMRDCEGRAAIMEIDNWNKEWGEAFETNPERRKSEVIDA